MRIRGVDVKQRSDYDESNMMDKLRTRQDNIQRINETPERGMKTYMRNRQVNYRKVKKECK